VKEALKCLLNLLTDGSYVVSFVGRLKSMHMFYLLLQNTAPFATDYTVTRFRMQILRPVSHLKSAPLQLQLLSTTLLDVKVARNVLLHMPVDIQLFAFWFGAATTTHFTRRWTINSQRKQILWLTVICNQSGAKK
jgi:hypothetical protein